MSAEEAAARANQRLAHTQLMMANSITSLRAISHRDWRTFVERQSLLETALTEDPAAVYRRMTFRDRDQYRHVIERLARRTGRDEAEVARQAVELARAGAAQASPEDPRRAHVGYYLVDEGRADLERAVGYHPPLGEWVHRLVLGHPNLVFVGGIVLGTVAALLAVHSLAAAGNGPSWVPALILLFALLPASDLAINLVNQLITTFLPPRTLPKLDLVENGGVPPELRTAVVVPILLPDLAAVREALDNLEALYLANRGPHLHFGLLSDFTDAPAEQLETDAAIVAAASEGIRALNVRYAGRHQRRVLPVPSPPPLQRTPGGVDGLGAQTRQAGRVQSVPARRPPGPLGLHRRWRRRRPSNRAATSSPWTPTPCFPRMGPSCWWGRWPIRSTARSTIRTGGGWWPGTGSSSPGWWCPCPRPTDRASPPSTPATRASTRTPPPSPTFTRTSTARGATRARGSTTSTRSSGPPAGGSRRTPCSLTT